MTGIESWAWEVEKRTPTFGIDCDQYKGIKNSYIEWLNDRLKEVKDTPTT
jgi:hypothetical protein